MSRAAAASSKTSAQDGSGVPCPSWFSLRSGARDGQKHLPDRLHTSDNEHDRPKGQLTNPTTENAGNNRMRDLNDQLKQRCRRNRDGNFATQCDHERVLVPVAKQIEDAGLRHLIATSLKPKHGGFNRSMQHTNYRESGRSVADEATTKDLLFR
jgi:hypothetical protein